MVEFDPTLAIIATTLRIPTEWFGWPDILTKILIPLVVVGAGFYFFLNNKLRIFQIPVVNIVIAALMSFLLLPYSGITIYLSILMIAFAGIQMWSNRILFFAIILSFYFFIGGNIRMVVYTLAAGGIVGILLSNEILIMMKIILVAAIAIGLYFLGPYIPANFNLFGVFS